MLQTDLQYLLLQGWTLIGMNLVQSPDGAVQTDQIEKAARLWRIKIDIRQRILKKDIDTNVRLT